MFDKPGLTEAVQYAIILISQKGAVNELIGLSVCDCKQRLLNELRPF